MRIDRKSHALHLQYELQDSNFSGSYQGKPRIIPPVKPQQLTIDNILAMLMA